MAVTVERVGCQGQGRQGAPWAAEATHQLGREVLGVGGAAAIAEDEEFAARVEGVEMSRASTATAGRSERVALAVARCSSRMASRVARSSSMALMVRAAGLADGAPETVVPGRSAPGRRAMS